MRCLYIETKHLFNFDCSHVADCDVRRCCCVKIIVIKLPNLVIPFGDIKADIVTGMLTGGGQDVSHNAILGEIFFVAWKYA